MAIKTNNGKKGGLLVGKSHKEGGIKAIVTDTGKPVELEGEEIIINKRSAKMFKKELSEINQAGGGVPIMAKGGEVGKMGRGGKLNFTKKVHDGAKQVEAGEIQVGYYKDNKYKGVNISTINKLKSFVRSIFDKNTLNMYESLWVVCVDNKLNVLGFYEASKGSSKKVLGDIKIISAIAVKQLATGVVLVHNHPNGNVNFSDGDKEFSLALEDALHTLDIRLIDSIVITEKEQSSMRSKDILKYERGGKISENIVFTCPESDRGTYILDEPTKKTRKEKTKIRSKNKQLKEDMASVLKALRAKKLLDLEGNLITDKGRAVQACINGAYSIKGKNDIKKELGGSITDEDKKEIYKKWKSLVNMSASELKSFMETQEGKDAGLSSSEAKEKGISSGRQSAKWILKMKDTPVSKWSSDMWRWANKQISFISRMRGNKGDLYDENKEKTRKHTSLLIWGHNPSKYGVGGEIDEDDFDNSKINNTFVQQLIQEHYDITGQGNKGQGDNIETALRFTLSSEKSNTSDRGTKRFKEEESLKLKQFCKENGLWINKPVFGVKVGAGSEQQVFYNCESNVTKCNSCDFYQSWSDYLINLIIHNYYFPDTNYALIGFTELDGVFCSVVSQPLVINVIKINLDEINATMVENGFEKIKDNDYINKEKGIIIEDLHDKNVLLSNGVPMFIDTCCSYTEDKLADGGTIDQPKEPINLNEEKETINKENMDYLESLKQAYTEVVGNEEPIQSEEKTEFKEGGVIEPLSDNINDSIEQVQVLCMDLGIDTSEIIIDEIDEQQVVIVPLPEDVTIDMMAKALNDSFLEYNSLSYENAGKVLHIYFDKKEKFGSGGEISPNKEVSASIQSSIKDLIDSGKWDLKPMEAGMLWNMFKEYETLIPTTREQNFNVDLLPQAEVSDSEKMKMVSVESLEEKGYVEDWASYSDVVLLTEKGKSFIDAVRARQNTRLAVKKGYDMFPEHSGIKEIEDKIKNRIDSPTINTELTFVYMPYNAPYDVEEISLDKIVLKKRPAFNNEYNTPVESTWDEILNRVNDGLIEVRKGDKTYTYAEFYIAVENYLKDHKHDHKIKHLQGVLSEEAESRDVAHAKNFEADHESHKKESMKAKHSEAIEGIRKKRDEVKSRVNIKEEEPNTNSITTVAINERLKSNPDEYFFIEGQSFSKYKIMKGRDAMFSLWVKQKGEHKFKEQSGHSHGSLPMVETVMQIEKDFKPPYLTRDGINECGFKNSKDELLNSFLSIEIVKPTFPDDDEDQSQLELENDNELALLELELGDEGDEPIEEQTELIPIIVRDKIVSYKYGSDEYTFKKVKGGFKIYLNGEAIENGAKRVQDIKPVIEMDIESNKRIKQKESEPIKFDNDRQIKVGDKTRIHDEDVEIISFDEDGNPLVKILSGKRKGKLTNFSKAFIMTEEQITKENEPMINEWMPKFKAEADKVIKNSKLKTVSEKADAFIESARKIKGVPFVVSKYFNNKYGNENAAPKMASENYIRELMKDEPIITPKEEKPSALIIAKKAKDEKVLNKEVNYSDKYGVMTKKDFIEKVLSEGGSIEMEMVAPIKEVSRTQYNRMNGRQQDEYEKKLAGEKKPEYSIYEANRKSFWTISKTEYDYGQDFLKSIK